MAILVTGCATQPGQQVPKTEPVVASKHVVLDENCAGLAKYVRAVAILRDINVRLEDVDYVLPKSPKLPIGTIQRTVYYRVDTDPNTTSSAIYKECVDMGYDTLIQRYQHEEVIYNIDVETKVKAIIDKQKTKKVIKK